MKAILTARPWQIFIFVSAAPILVLVFMKQILNEPVAGPYIIVVAAFPWYGWLYVVGTNLFTISRFPRRATIVYMLLFIGIAFGFLLLALLPEERPITEQAVVGMLGIGLVLFGTLFLFVLIARGLTAAEGKPSDRFTEYSGNFFTIWLFPFSCYWFLQRRVRTIFLNPIVKSVNGPRNKQKAKNPELKFCYHCGEGLHERNDFLP